LEVFIVGIASFLGENQACYTKEAADAGSPALLRL
jgi:hypothetical protein